MSIVSDVKLIQTKRFGDDRGWMTESYNERAFASLGVEVRFVQDNHSLSRPVGTLRGLHCQFPPHAQAKLVRCVRGHIFDVLVDVRRGSPTYGYWASTELSAEDGRQLFVPVGFLHGFMTLAPDTEVIYKVSEFYAPHAEGGVRWDDPTINIEWPLPRGVAPLLSPKDQRLPLLADFESPFSYDGGHPLLPLEAAVG
jgi:dTDP-4-dehydrorhamnose 3,5-epimerase